MEAILRDAAVARATAAPQDEAAKEHAFEVPGPPHGLRMKPSIHSGRVAGEFFKDGMIVTFDQPCRAIARDDTLSVRTPGGETLEIFPAAIRRDGGVSVWYAPHPLLRHWLGWMERIDDTHWAFRMEAMHIDILNGIPELCGDG